MYVGREDTMGEGGKRGARGRSNDLCSGMELPKVKLQNPEYVFIPQTNKWSIIKELVYTKPHAGPERSGSQKRHKQAI